MDNRPIYWHEGLFLRQQHFQQQDLFNQSQRNSLFGLSMPYAWGLTRLSVVQSALNNQIFELENCEVLFQDGTIVSFPGNAQLNYRSFDGKWDASGGPLPVYLGLRKLNQGESNVDVAGDVEAPSANADVHMINRLWLSARTSPTFDLYADRQQEGIQFLYYHLAIFFGAESTQAVDYHLIKIAELERFGNEVRLSDEYIPPMLNVAGSQGLQRLLRDIKEQLTSRARELALYKKDMSDGSIPSRDIAFLMALRTLNRYVPLIHQYSELSQVLPWDYYGLLRQIVGELSTFSKSFYLFGGLQESTTDGLPAYRHEDIYTCFHLATNTISELLNELTAGPDYSARLMFDGTYFASELSDRIFQGNNRFYLRVRVEGSDDSVVAELQTTAKLSSREYLPIIIARALPGVGVNHLSTPPNELPRRSDSVYFEVDPHSDAWLPVRDGANIAIYFDNPPGNVDIELLVVYG